MEKFVTLFVLACLGIAHSSSISPVDTDSVESLAKSMILMDWTTSSVPAIPSGTVIRSSQSVTEKNEKLAFSMQDCRAACVAKYSKRGPPTTPSPSKIEEATTLIMDAISEEDKAVNEYEKLLPKMLRLKRSADAESTFIRNVEIAKCWKSCELRGSRQTDNKDMSSIVRHQVTNTKMSAGDSDKIKSSEAPSPPAPFEPQLVSLIHQNAEIVIAEIRWNDANSKSGREYQVTWEIVGGGLKGYLITESTTVTLSLWPNTSYKISVATTEAMKQSASLETRPLLVDTSIVSSASNQPSSLLNSDADDEDDIEDESVDEEYLEEDYSDDKSIGKVLALCLLSTVFLLFVFTFVTFVGIKLKQCCSRQSNGYPLGPALLQSNDSCETVYTPSVAIISQKIGLPLGGSNAPYSSSYKNVFSNSNVYKTLSVSNSDEYPTKQCGNLLV